MSLYSQRVAQDNPVLYFENNSSGVNNTGSRTPTISTGTSNVFYSTGGVANSPYIYVGDYNDSNYGFEYSDSTTTFNDKAFSITGWFKVSASDNQQAFNWIFHTGTSGNGINIDVNQSLAYLSATPNGFTNQVSSPGVSLNAWHHFAWTVDSTNMKLYIDGSLVSTASTPSTISMDSQVKYWMRWTSSGTTRYGATGNYDELAVFDSTLSATTIAEHYAAGFAIGYSATPATASALAVQPTTIIDSGYVAQAATASATFAEASWNFVNLPQMLDTYMQTLSFEQWYRFDQPKKIRNYGTGGNAETAWAFNGSATTDILGGRQGSGALVIYGQQGNTVPLAFGVNQPYSTEITDNEFAIGFWFKAESGFGDKLADIIKYYNPFGSDYYNLRIRNTGYVEWTMQGNQQNQVVHLTNVADGNWHFIHARASTSGNTISINVDNGTAVSTTTNGTWPSVSALTFGNVLNSGTNNKKGYISHYWVNGYSTITSTQIGNMITYAGTPIQAATILPEPTVKFTNAYNDYIQANGSTIEFRMDEATGTPVNFGTIDSLSIGLNGSNVSYLQPTVNRYAYKFTNANTYLQGDWTAASGTFSTNAQQTMVVRFKSNGYKSFEQILGSTGMFGFLGTGITIALGANNGHISARLNKGFGPTDTETITWSTNVADNEWHLAVACKSGSNFTLYVDGKQRAQITNSAITPANSGTWGVAAEGKYNGTGSNTKELYIDEFAVLATEITAAEAFEMYQAISLDTDNEISALMVNPTYSAGYGPTIAAAPMIATAAEGAVFPFVVPLTGQALFQQPNFEATKNTSNAVTAWTASALMEDITFSIGEFNGAQHMEATATFPQPQLFIPGFWFDNPKIATAEMVQPTVVTTLGALIKPQSLNAKAIFQLPPAYYLITDDKWYNRLLDVDYQSSDYTGKITFFNTSDSIYVGGSYDGWQAKQPSDNYNIISSPLPVASAGILDPAERKSLKLRNIELAYRNNESYFKGWTMETMIRTTKANQYLAAGYLLGDVTSSVSRDKRSGIRLKDGKIAFTNIKDRSLGRLTSLDSIAFTGFKNIADGEWHHLIIQYRDDDDRIQVWIDGKLDIQRYGETSYAPIQIGYNSNDIDAYSDFEVSAIAINKESFVLEREIKLNYFAAIGHTPFEATPATAEVGIGQESRARGNRGRALMLYFWPTFNAKSGYYASGFDNPLGTTGWNTTDKDQGREPFDYDTFYGLTTYLTDEVQKFYDWDVFPLPVKRFYSGDTYRGDKHPLLNESVMISQGTQGRTYVDPVTENYRYVNLMEDVYDLDQYDAIFFRNYPDQSREQDEAGLNSKTEVDEYFNLQDKTLFKEFLTNLRQAVDTYNISLFVTNPQLAVDLGIIRAATPVPLMRNEGTFIDGEWSDNRAPVVTGRVKNDGTPLDLVNEYGAGWYDTFFNDKHRVINTLEYLTDDNTFIWTDYAYYQNADQNEYGGPNRLYKRYENRPYGLQVGDEFVFADSGNPKFRLPYQAIKPEDLLAGIPITALSNTIWNQSRDSYVQAENPYKDYITTVALPVGTELQGKLTGGKIFVSFSENLATSVTSGSTQWDTNNTEYHLFDMATEYWVNIAYNANIITNEERLSYLAGTSTTQPPLKLIGDTISQYWSLNGNYLVSQLTARTDNLKGFVGADLFGLTIDPLSYKRTRGGLAQLPTSNSVRLRDALGRFASGGGSGSLQGGNLKTFAVSIGRTYNTGTLFIPSINTRGLWWLSDKVRLKATGAVALKATAQMPNPAVTADHPGGALASPMLATAMILETNFKPSNVSYPVLPMTATATINNFGGRANYTSPMTATVLMKQPSISFVDAEEVVVYLGHVDPILYLRREIIT